MPAVLRGTGLWQDLRSSQELFHRDVQRMNESATLESQAGDDSGVLDSLTRDLALVFAA